MVRLLISKQEAFFMSSSERLDRGIATGLATGLAAGLALGYIYRMTYNQSGYDRAKNSSSK